MSEINVSIDAAKVISDIYDTAYNQAISDAVQLFYNYWQSDDTVNSSTTKEFIDMLEKLKKPSQSPNQ